MNEKRIKALFLVVWLVLISVAFFVYFRSGVLLADVPMEIRSWIAQFGVWGPIVYIAVNSLRALTLFPATVFTVASTLLFGLEMGIIYAYIAENIGANLSFVVGRYFGGAIIEKFSARLKYFPPQTMVRENGFVIVLLMRLLFFPFDAVGYICGAYKMRQRDFALATAIAVIPGLIAFASIGNIFAEPGKSLMIFLPFFVFGLLVAQQLKKRTKLGRELQDIKESGAG